MAVYTYQAFDGSGKKRKGVIEGESELSVKQLLREKGLVIASIALRKHSARSGQLRGEKLVAFTFQMAQLAGAGLPVYESLLALEEQSRREPYHQILLSLSEEIKSGKTLSQAMALHPMSFDYLYISMIAAGEKVGAVEKVLEKLSVLLQKQEKLRQQIRNAMIYPGVLFCFSLLVLSLLVGFVVPSIESMFEESQMNGFTYLVITVSHLLRSSWWALLALVLGGGVLCRRWFRSSRGKAVWQTYGLRVPVLGKIMVQTAVARFARTLSTLLEGGLPLIDALRVSRNVMNNGPLEKEIEQAEVNILQGHTLSRELMQAERFPEFAARMIAVGEESGGVAAMLGKVAEIYEDSVEKSTNQLMTLLQPIILIFMGAMIGMILLAILLPLTDISSLTM